MCTALLSCLVCRGLELRIDVCSSVFALRHTVLTHSYVPGSRRLQGWVSTTHRSYSQLTFFNILIKVVFGCIIGTIKRHVLVHKEAKHKKPGTRKKRSIRVRGVRHDHHHHHYQVSRLAPRRSRTPSLPASARRWLELSLPSEESCVLMKRHVLVHP